MFGAEVGVVVKLLGSVVDDGPTDSVETGAVDKVMKHHNQFGHQVPIEKAVVCVDQGIPY